MSPIDDFLGRVERRLLVRRRHRREILEEMRGHLESLQAERGADFPDADAIAKAFGEPRGLARTINASVPWTQARLPWALLAIGPIAMVVLLLLMMPVYSAFNGWFDNGMRGAAAHLILLTVSSLANWVGPVAAMAYAIRLGVRGSHAWLGVLCPSLIYTGMIVVSWLVRPDVGMWHLLALGIVSLLAISSLLARIAAVESTPLGRVRLALLLVILAQEVVTAAVSPLPLGAATIVPRLGKLLAMAILALVLPRLVRRDRPATA
jgi:hypothetical protein